MYGVEIRTKITAETRKNGTMSWNYLFLFVVVLKFLAFELNASSLCR